MAQDMKMHHTKMQNTELLSLLICLFATTVAKDDQMKLKAEHAGDARRIKQRTEANTKACAYMVQRMGHTIV